MYTFTKPNFLSRLRDRTNLCLCLKKHIPEFDESDEFEEDKKEKMKRSIHAIETIEPYELRKRNFTPCSTPEESQTGRFVNFLDVNQSATEKVDGPRCVDLHATESGTKIYVDPEGTIIKSGSKVAEVAALCSNESDIFGDAVSVEGFTEYETCCDYANSITSVSEYGSCPESINDNPTPCGLV